MHATMSCIEKAWILVCFSSTEQAPEEALWDQPDGGAHPEGHHPVLRIRDGEAEGPLSQHPLLQGRCTVLKGSMDTWRGYERRHLFDDIQLAATTIEISLWALLCHPIAASLLITRSCAPVVYSFFTSTFGMYISVPIAPDKPVHHLLQLHPEGGAPGQEDHPTGLLLLLHPRQDDAGVQEQSVPRLQKRTVPEPGLHR